MNIGIVTTWFERGAAYVSRHYRDVLDKNHSVYIYARGGEKYGKDEREWDKEHVTWGKKNYEASTAVKLKDFSAWLEKNEIEVVLFNEQKWWDVVLLCEERSIPHGAYIDYYTEESIPFFGIHDFLICNTLRHYEAFNWHPHCHYVPWGTNTESFIPGEKKLADPDKVVFFHSCGMSPERKGTDLLIRAFDSIKNKENAHLIVHTQTELTGRLKKEKAIIDKLLSCGKMELINRTVSEPGLYTLGDVYVYPSRLEGIGLTIAEAISSGLIPLVTDNPPMNEFVPDDEKYRIQLDRLYARKDGYYWPKSDANIADLTQKMSRYIRNKKEIPRLKRWFRDYAVEKLNWMTNAECINTIFENAKKENTKCKEEAKELIIADSRNPLNRMKKIASRVPYLRSYL